MRNQRIEDISSLTEEMKESIRKRKKAMETISDIREIILFGSRARGDYRPDSDIDIIVLIDGESKHDIWHKLSDSCYEIYINDNFDLNTLYYNYDEFYEGKNISYSLRHNVMKEGVVIEI